MVLEVDGAKLRIVRAKVVTLANAVHDAQFGDPIDSIRDRVGVVAHTIEEFAPLAKDEGHFPIIGHRFATSLSDVTIS